MKIKKHTLTMLLFVIILNITHFQSVCFSKAPSSSPAFENQVKVVPLTSTALYAISKKMDVPFSALVLLLHTENGYVGLASTNESNGSIDYGPFQVNSVHLNNEIIKAAGISAEQLQYNGVINAQVAAWWFKKKLEEAGSVFKAIGLYHSQTPKFKLRYQKHFLTRLNSFKNVHHTIEQANRTQLQNW